MNRRLFLKGFVASVSGLLVPTGLTLVEDVRRAWALDRTMLNGAVEGQNFIAPPVSFLFRPGLGFHEPIEIVDGWMCIRRIPLHEPVSLVTYAVDLTTVPDRT